ncbi:SAM-dependent methyltransferase [Breoghania sp. L-A4]|uniref:SAM-dependent methyltransferase n=1 Tax=Breoghania sp. L-A4 TaxID=2304600 RepID=UPI0019675361|nr:SAM-dependent methyltransferase [Breoghania sp. L-A4]
MVPVGFVRGGRTEATKDGWAGTRARIVLRDDLFGAESVAGLDAVSHIEVVFHFHAHADESLELGARHPRGNRDWPRVGIFAQRGRMRVNRIGVSVCRLLNTDGLSLEVEGLDAIDGTPVLDVKPVWSGYDPRGERCEPEWAREIMARYW